MYIVLIIISLIGLRYLTWIWLKTMKSRVIEAHDHVGFVLHRYETAYWLHFDIFFIRLWRHSQGYIDFDEDGHSWGICFYIDEMQSTYWRWGKFYCFLEYPWAWKFHKWEFMKYDGTFSPNENAQFQVTKPYTYVLKDGTEQHRIATVKAERIWHKIKWLPFIKRKRDSITVDFDQEVGEQTGSYKGGVLGCGYSLKKGESVAECLERMERERRFD